jgi:hypothetical protein
MFFFCGWCKRREFVFPEIVFIGIERHCGHQDPVPFAFHPKKTGKLPVICLITIIKAECGTREQVSISWEIKFTLIVHDKRSIVYKQFGKKGDKDHNKENDKGIVSPLYGFEPPDFFYG